MEQNSHLTDAGFSLDAWFKVAQIIRQGNKLKRGMINSEPYRLLVGSCKLALVSYRYFQI